MATLTKQQPLTWSRRARVWRDGEFETRTWTSLDGRWRVQECSVRMYSLRSTWWLVSRLMGQGWAPVSRHKTRQAAMTAVEKHREASAKRGDS